MIPFVNSHRADIFPFPLVCYLNSFETSTGLYACFRQRKLIPSNLNRALSSRESHAFETSRNSEPITSSLLIRGGMTIQGGWMGGGPMSHVDYKKW